MSSTEAILNTEPLKEIDKKKSHKPTKKSYEEQLCEQGLFNLEKEAQWGPLLSTIP